MEGRIERNKKEGAELQSWVTVGVCVCVRHAVWLTFCVCTYVGDVNVEV